jgi:hypothetical protein
MKKPSGFKTMMNSLAANAANTFKTKTASLVAPAGGKKAKLPEYTVQDFRVYVGSVQADFERYNRSKQGKLVKARERARVNMAERTAECFKKIPAEYFREDHTFLEGSLSTNARKIAQTQDTVRLRCWRAVKAV